MQLRIWSGWVWGDLGLAGAARRRSRLFLLKVMGRGYSQRSVYHGGYLRGFPHSLPYLRFRPVFIVLIKASGLIVCVLLLATRCAGEDTSSRDMLQPFFKQHCLRCHGDGDEVQGEVNLTKIFKLADLQKDVRLLRAVLGVLDKREMPPEGEPNLAAELRSQWVAQLQQLLRQAVTEQQHLAHAPIRRMNRFQYNNAVVDLFQLQGGVFALPERMMREYGNYFRPETGKMPEKVSVGSRPLGKSQLIELRLAGAAPFPQDLRAEHGYDNRGDHLSLSPLLMESFLNLGRSITESPDFTAKRVGIWGEFFAPPRPEAKTQHIIRTRLQPFLTRAFRRPVDDQTLRRYVTFVETQVGQGASYTEAMKAVAAATIASPKFLYLFDRANQEAAVESLTDFELASRLSFFLWGSLPDQQLMDLAVAGNLKDEQVLLAQVERMLRDRKLKRFCDSFPAQWLQLERIISAVPNRVRFPNFYFSKYRASMHMMVEPLLLFEAVLIENRPITQFVDADFTYQSALLRKAYLPADQKVKIGGGVTKLAFQRSPVTDRRYGGMITNAAVMAMTSGPEETKPITRGAWVATVIFNEPPDPPPADVPPLPDQPAAEEDDLTLRERLALHRERADCRGCHEQIDPLGFALENYDTVGRWRERYENGREIDVAGTLFREHAFDDVIEFKDAILAEKDRFARGFAGHLLSFALARELEPADTVAVDQIAAAVAADDYRIQTVIKQVVLSKPFRNKKNPKQATGANVP